MKAEIFKKNVVIEKKIGQGHFGEVFCGKWGNTPVSGLFY
jgi:hypothetical protein